MNMITALLCYISILALPFSILGIVTVYYWIRPAKSPVDKSNIINSIRLWWFALTRREEFVKIFTWLERDEWENFNNE